MNTIGTYLLQMSCWLVSFWLVYVVLLKNETFFRLNRWFLIIGILFSTIAPLVPVTYKVYNTIEPAVFTLSESMSTVVTSPSSSVEPGIEVNYWLIIYLFGFIFYLIRFINQQFNLYRIRKQSKVIMLGNLKVYRTEKDIIPFSFFNNIYVSSKVSNNTELETVIAHEKVHINERHWADLLLLEVARTFQWFNPLLQFYRKAMMQNHEYLADIGTIGFGVSARTYRAVLANQMLGNQVVSFANSFTFRNSTKRLLMMKRDKSKPIKQLKFLFILPFVALIIMGFAKPEYVFLENTNIDVIHETVNGKVYDQWGDALQGVKITTISNSVTATSDENGAFTLKTFRNENDISASKDGYSYTNSVFNKENKRLAVLMLKNKESQLNTLTITGQVIDEKGIPLKNALITIVRTNGQLVSKVKSDNNGNFSISGARMSDIIAVSCIGFETFKTNVNNQQEITVQLKLIPESVSINNATSSTTDKIKNQNEDIIQGTVFDENGEKIIGCNIIKVDDNGRFLFGTVSDKNGYFRMNGVNPGDKLMISFIGFKQITTQASKEMSITMHKEDIALEEVVITGNKTKEVPLNDRKIEVFVDGKIFVKELTPDFNYEKADIKEFGNLINVAPEDIKTIEVLKGEKANAIYGSNSNKIIVVIKTKDGANLKSPAPKPTLFNSGENQKSEYPLVIVDGKETDLKWKPDQVLNEIGNEKIDKIEVYKGEEARKKYGEEGKNGIVEITTKKEKTNSSGNTETNEVFIIVEDMPRFSIDGINGFREYIEQNISYPLEAMEKGISGRVYVQFTVNREGRVQNAKIARGVHPLLDAEALRVVEGSPLWIPGKQRGEPVNVLFTFPVNFVQN